MRPELSAAFGDPDVVEAYRLRPPYPAEVFDVFEELITDRPRRVLDIGAGDGALARPMAARVDRVDAVDVSAAMLAAGARQPGGDQPNLRWILGAAETAELAGPYALVTAGASLHWMDWPQVLSRLAAEMTQHAFLAIADHGAQALPWQDAVREVIVRHSRSPKFDPGFSLPDELAARGLLEISGSATSPETPFRQSLSSYVEQFHSTASLARLWMTEDESDAFDRAIEQVVQPHAVDGMLEMKVVATITWGRPLPAR
jgi:SAM-dependent methyltransferase